MSRRRVQAQETSRVELVKREIAQKKALARKRRRKRRMRRLGLLLLVIAIVWGVVYIDSQPFSRVSVVEVVGNQYINNDIIIKESRVDIGDRLIFTFAPLINRRISRIPGIAFTDVNVYYTKGKVVLNVKEKDIVAFMNEGPTVLFSDGAFVEVTNASVSNYPYLVGFTHELIAAHPEFADRLSRIDPTAFYNISEIHVEDNAFETLYMQFVMNNGFRVYTSVENMMLMNHYTEIVSSIMSGDHPDNRCIFFLDYYEDVPDSQVSIARPCEE